jgi:tetratricopeptide (TPR) repeat protein
MIRSLPAAWLGLVALLLVLGVRIAPARAGSCTGEDWKRAVAWGDTGKDLYEREKSYAKAYENFSEAARICPSPRWLGWMARCQRQQKKLLEARDLYAQARTFSYASKTFNEALEDFDRAKATAQGEHDALVPRIPTVRFTFHGAAPWDGALTVDDKQVAPDAGGQISLNPGEHRAVLAVRGSGSSSRPRRRRRRRTRRRCPRRRDSKTSPHILSSLRSRLRLRRRDPTCPRSSCSVSGPPPP